MKGSNANLFRRFEKEQERLLKASMPNSGVVEYIDLIPKVKPSGFVIRNGVRVRKAVN